MATALKTETLIVLGVALAAIYLAQRAGKAVVNTVADALPYIDPTDDRNLINQGATSLWQWATGSTGTIGGDMWDYLHKAEPLPGGSPGQLVNYSAEQAAKDKEAIRRLESGYHGM